MQKLAAQKEVIADEESLDEIIDKYSDEDDEEGKVEAQD